MEHLVGVLSFFVSSIRLLSYSLNFLHRQFEGFPNMGRDAKGRTFVVSEQIDYPNVLMYAYNEPKRHLLQIDILILIRGQFEKHVVTAVLSHREIPEFPSSQKITYTLENPCDSLPQEIGEIFKTWSNSDWIWEVGDPTTQALYAQAP